jgi:nucleotide-binding universal stress UspA family protein
LELRTILVATDLQEGGFAALKYAQAIAAEYFAKLIIVHVVDPAGYAFTGNAPELETASTQAKGELKKIEYETKMRGISVHSVIQRGVICTNILDEVKAHNADLLVLGTRAKFELGKAALGAIARQLLINCPCPILTVSPGAQGIPASFGTWRRILVATDFSEPALTALRCAHQLVRSQLFVLHVCSCANTSKCPGYLERLRFLAPMNESHTVPVEHFAVSGDISKLIVEYAQRLKVDLVVLGSPSTQLNDQEIHTSTILKAISQLDCPVLCVPPSHEAKILTPIQEAALK